MGSLIGILQCDQSPALPKYHRSMEPFRVVRCCSFLLLLACAWQCGAVELRVSRDALERTLKQQLFSGPAGVSTSKDRRKTACYVYADDAKVDFVQDRIVVKIKTKAHMGKSLAGACIGISMAPDAEVSVAPYGEGDSIGFPRRAALESQRSAGTELPAHSVLEPSGAIQHESRCRGFIAQGPRRLCRLPRDTS